MKKTLHLAGIAALGLAALATLGASKASAQDPILTPVIVDTAVPIIVNAVTPKPKNTGLVKFEGFVMNANTAQVTVRAKGNDMAIRSFSLSQPAATKMQQIVDKGGYQYGDKITVYYDPQSLQAMKFKGKPSPSL
jgi:hypothetical protein